MAIWLACQIRRRFLVVVHQEFLMEQWRGELERSIPGIRIGVIQQNKVQTGMMEPTVPTVTELKERLRARGLKVGGKREELLARLREVEPEPEPALYDCTICMIQTVAARSWSADAFKDYGFAIFDECHHLGAEYFSKALMSIQTKHMLGLSATPERLDALDSVFLSYLGPVRYQIKVRDPDESVEVRVLRYTAADAEYADTPVDWRGEVCRPKLCNQLAAFTPRTRAICAELESCIREGRQILILSDRIEQLKGFEAEFKARGHTSIGYYIGGMKAAARDLSATKQIVLGTFMLAAEGMNIRGLSAVVLATPKSRIEQAVGRIFRLKKEERIFQPVIYDVIDSPHDVCIRQYRKRRQFYKQCAYRIRMLKGAAEVADGPVDEGEAEQTKQKEEALPPGPLFR
jgi:superfamily II DNA or RNA helicase